MKRLTSNQLRPFLNLGLAFLLCFQIQFAYSSESACATKDCALGPPCNITNGSFTIATAQVIHWTANNFGVDGGDFYITTDLLGNPAQLALSTNLMHGNNAGSQLLPPGTYHIGITYFGMFDGSYCIEYNLTASIGVAPTSKNFGDFLEGVSPSSWQTFTISNTGDLDVNVSNIVISGDVARFELDLPSLPDAPTTTFRVRYLPAAAGAGVHSATVTINATNTDGVTVSPLVVNVWGETKLRIPDIGCTGGNCAGSLNLGSADGDVGQSIVINKSFNNSGTGDLLISSITLVNDSPSAPFSLNGSPNVSPLGDGNSRNVSINFSPPPGENVYCGHLIIQTNDPDEPIKHCYFSATGHHPVPRMLIDELLLDFKEVELGFSYTKAIIIRNAGDATLTGIVSDAACSADPSCNLSMLQWSLTETGAFNIPPDSPPVVFRQTYTPNSLASHTISLNVSSNDLTFPSATVILVGEGVSPVPMDNVLVLDRSGSMDQIVGTGSQRKIDALRRAGNLYLDLLRPEPGSTDTGDKIGLVKYNESNSIYLPLEYKTPTNAPGTHTNAAMEALSATAVNNDAQLKPDGLTGIGGAMQTGASMFPAASSGRSQIMVVMTDGMENVTPYINDVLGPIHSSKPDLKIYSVGLGNTANLELAKLQSITNVANGFHQVSGDLLNENIFALEEFYFKIFSNANRMDLIVDPTNYEQIAFDSTSRIIQHATVVSSDRYAIFLVLDDPVLRAYYDLELVDPNGHIMVLGSSIGGIPVQISQRLTYKIYKVIFPDISQSASYVGDWLLRLTPNKKWSRKAMSSYMAENKAYSQSSISIANGYIPIGFAASVKSDYNMEVSVTASQYAPGGVLTLLASLKDRGWPSTGASVFVDIANPIGAKTSNILLYDDGTHGDSQANDGLYTNQYSSTALSGSYKCYFHGTGINERGELVPREATRYVSLVDPASANPNPSNGLPSGKRALGVSFHAGYTIPYGDFDNNHNWGSLFEIDIEYPILDQLSLDFVLGQYYFDPDYRLLGIIGYLKGYMSYGAWRPYLAAGGGVYKPSGGTFNRPGYSFGVGINRPLHQKLFFDFGVFYHSIAKEKPSLEFFGFKGGLIFRF